MLEDGDGFALAVSNLSHQRSQYVQRIRRTFVFEPEDSASPYKLLVLGKKIFMITARGDSGFELGDRNEKSLNWRQARECSF